MKAYLKSIKHIKKMALTGLLAVGLVTQQGIPVSAADLSSTFNNLNLTSAYKKQNENNPIITQRYAADPSVMVYNDTVYLYATNDSYEYSNGSIKENSYSTIQTLNCISSKDLVNWTDHGTIQVAGSRGVAKWAGNSWAPCATYKKINGKDKFFLYFANNANGIGVLVADSPTGPWTDPIGKALISRSTPNCSDVVWCFDPAVFVDSDGTGYLYFGGGIPTGQNAHPKTARVVKLGSDMTSLAGTPITIDAPYLFEDSGINKIGNKYYYSYCSNFNTAGSGINGGAIEYMVSNSPTGPFTFTGEVFKNPGVYFNGSGGNNHHSIFEFKGSYYLAYHTRTLELAQFGKNLGYRSTHLDKLSVNNGVLSEVKGTMAGASQVSYLNPYERVEAETMAIQAGVNVSGSGNTLVTDIHAGDWIGVKGVDFSDGLSKITVSAKSSTGGVIKVCTNSPSGTALGYIEVPNTSGAFVEVSSVLSNISGVKDLYFVFSGNMELDYWKAVAYSGQPTETDTTVKNYATLSDGWYYLKNTNAQKYLQVKDNVGANGQNVEIGTGTGANGQKWYLTNTGNGYVTFKNGLDYMLDVSNGANVDGTNIQIYSPNGMDAQKFKLVPTATSNVYGILTKSSVDTKSLDVYNFGTTDGSNVCEWTYYKNSCQMWVLEPCSAPESTVPVPTPTPTPTPTPDSPSTTASMSIKIFSDWSDGATADITITNNTGKNLNGWTCTFTTNRPISSIWNAELVSSNGTTYTISSPSWQSNLAAGASYTFGCNMGSGPANVTITNISLK